MATGLLRTQLLRYTSAKRKFRYYCCVINIHRLATEKREIVCDVKTQQQIMTYPSPLEDDPSLLDATGEWRLAGGQQTTCCYIRSPPTFVLVSAKTSTFTFDPLVCRKNFGGTLLARPSFSFTVMRLLLDGHQIQTRIACDANINTATRFFFFSFSIIEWKEKRSCGISFRENANGRGRGNEEESNFK